MKNGGSTTAKSIACEDFYVPNAGSTESGLTEVASIDLDNPGADPRETGILGRVDTVFGNADSMYLAARAWVEPPFQWNDIYAGSSSSSSSGGGSVGSDPGTAPSLPPPQPVPEPAPLPKQNVRPAALRPLADAPSAEVIAWSTSNTHIHKFEFRSDPKFANYVASGTLPGQVKDQFSLDEKDGYLRIATTENRQYVSIDGRVTSGSSSTVVSSSSSGATGSTSGSGGAAVALPNTVNHVFTMEQRGGWLEQAGSVGDLAPNEQIYSVRFLEGRGYVVTFRQVDPLFVIDLQNPRSPTVLGALKIPGFSEYMHPLGANHLLTIGRDASLDGRQQGLQLQIFDVTDGANPKVVHKFTYNGSEYGSSEAEYDHKAFTYFADKGLLAFPYYTYGNGTAEKGTIGGMRSTLELFRVDLGTGFTKVGSVDNTTLVATHANGYCGGYFAPSVRRGVFLENVVYSISYGGIVAKDVNDLAAAGTSLPLPTPFLNEGYGPATACY